jgi:hypothetical protein
MTALELDPVRLQWQDLTHPAVGCITYLLDRQVYGINIAVA